PCPGDRLQPPAPGVEAPARRLLPGAVPGDRRDELRGARHGRCPLGDPALLRRVVRGGEEEEGRFAFRLPPPQEGPPPGALVPRDIFHRRRPPPDPGAQGSPTAGGAPRKGAALPTGLHPIGDPAGGGGAAVRG